MRSPSAANPKPVAPAGYAPKQTEVSLVMSHFFVRYLAFVYRNFAGDLTLPIILGEVAHHNVTRHFAGQISAARAAQLALPVERMWREMSPCNAFSLSQATGIPRETVRRKIGQLVKQGWLARNPRGEVTITPALAAHFLPERNVEMLAELLETSAVIGELLRVGAKARP
jgi:hypothetical protein